MDARARRTREWSRSLARAFARVRESRRDVDAREKVTRETSGGVGTRLGRATLLYHSIALSFARRRMRSTTGRVSNISRENSRPRSPSASTSTAAAMSSASTKSTTPSWPKDFNSPLDDLWTIGAHARAAVGVGVRQRARGRRERANVVVGDA